VNQSRLLEVLPEAERARLQPFLEEIDLEDGATLIEAGAPIDSVWFPHDCVTSTVVETRDGATIEVGLMGTEGLVGLSLLLGRTLSNTTVLVQIPGKAARMKASDFVTQVVERKGPLYYALLRYTDAFLAMVSQTAACNSLHAVDARLSRWILMTHDRVQRDELPLTHEFLGYMLGVRRASVSVAANALQNLGLISYNRGMIRVLNRAGIEKQSCECYFIVRRITDDLYDPDIFNEAVS